MILYDFLYEICIHKKKRMVQSKNIEIKARCSDLEAIRIILTKKNSDYKGLDHQIDTYFNVSTGRLKLREGNIENNLIYYNRPNQSGPKQSDFTLFKTENGSGLNDILNKSLGIKVVVDKKREIHFIENVKFHLDTVKDLGTFIEIEVIDIHGNQSIDDMNEVCEKYLKLFSVSVSDLIECSYSDLLIQSQ